MAFYVEAHEHRDGKGHDFAQIGSCAVGPACALAIRRSQQPDELLRSDFEHWGGHNEMSPVSTNSAHRRPCQNVAHGGYVYNHFAQL